MIIGILVIALPLLIYVIGALSVKRNEFSTPDEYFVAYRKVGITAFSSSSIAYAFQVSTIYPFLLWGASGTYFVPAVNTICWGFGIFIFLLCFNRYKKFIGKNLTLHGFLGEHYGSSVRIVASYLTIIGFLGLAIAETYFGSKVLLSIIHDKNIFYFIILFALLFVYGYIAYGGQMSSIRTDQLQLIISYIGIFGLMLYFCYLLIINGVHISGPLTLSFIILIIYIPIVLLSRKFKFIKFSEKDSKGNKTINATLNTTIVILFVLVTGISILVLSKSNFEFSVHNLFNIEGFGIPGLLSLAILPLCFQFVDLSNWQRLLSVKPENQADKESLYKNKRKGLLIYAIESPFTWIIFIFFGLLAVTSLPNFAFQDLLVDLPKSLINSGNIIQEFFGYTFIVSIIAIMLSTVDSFIIAIIFTFVYDSYGKTRKLLDSKNEISIKTNYKSTINAGKIFGLLTILLGVLLFVIFDKKIPNGGELFINLLFAFYAAQISFFPLIFGILFLKKHPSTFWANASMIIGAVGGIGVGIYSVLFKPEWAWYPILICISLSSIIYFLGLIILKVERNN